jgi:hypothetical protein
MANPRHSAAKRQREQNRKDKARDKKERLAARRARKEAGLPDLDDAASDAANPDSAVADAAVDGPDTAVDRSPAAQGGDNAHAPTSPGSSNAS